jgi:putative hydrolase of the HAD superfamily
VAIKNIIFDLGGIFLKVNYQKTQDAFVKLGITNFDDYYRQDFVSKPFEQIEVGEISSEEFYEGIRNITNTKIADTDLQNAWNAMLGEFWLDRLKWLDEINKKYSVYLFSNTNQIHYDCFQNIYEETNPKHKFSDYFIKDYYSQILGLRKPNIESYHAILKEQHLKASETLFVDDTYKNIEGAESAGLRTLLITNSMSLINEVENILLED